MLALLAFLARWKVEWFVEWVASDSNPAEDPGRGEGAYERMAFPAWTGAALAGVPLPELLSCI